MYGLCHLLDFSGDFFMVLVCSPVFCISYQLEIGLKFDGVMFGYIS